MRITVNLDDDLLDDARQLARERKQSLGRVLSELARLRLQHASEAPVGPGTIPTLPRKPGGRPVTSRDVRRLLDRIE